MLCNATSKGIDKLVKRGSGTIGVAETGRDVFPAVPPTIQREYVCVEEVWTTKVQWPHRPHLLPRENLTKELSLLH
jgi:hypothetical protein